jgi:hypothetical protein
MPRTYQDLSNKEKSVIDMMNALVHEYQKLSYTIDDDSINFKYAGIPEIVLKTDNSIWIGGVRIH